MKKKLNIRNIIIIMLCITTIFLGIGFIVLSLKLEAKNNEQPILKVEFTKIEAQTPVKGGIIAPIETKTIINDGLTAKFNFTLNTPQDELAYTITIKNTGTLPAKIINILPEPDYLNNEAQKNAISPVTITQTPITDNKLTPGEEISINLIVSYGNTGDIRQKNISYQLTILATTINWC